MFYVFITQKIIVIFITIKYIVSMIPNDTYTIKDKKVIFCPAKNE